MTGWIGAQCLVLDTETTGVSVHDDRIVTACAAITRDGHITYQRDWLIAVDVEIPQAAIDVHGIDNERAQKEGVAPIEAVAEIANAVRFAVHSGRPVVAFLAAFDLSLLNAECARYGLGTLAEFCDHDIAPVICPLTVDKAIDRYRKGKRTLTATCEVFDVTLNDAHTAGGDVAATAQVLHRMGERAGMGADALRALYADRKVPNDLVRAWQALGRMSLNELHAAQIDWSREQTKSLGKYWAEKADEARHRAEQAAEDAQVAATGGDDEARDKAETVEAAALLEAADFNARVDGLCDAWPIRPLPDQEATP